MDNCFCSFRFILQILPFLNKRRPSNRTVLLLAFELTPLHHEGWTMGWFRPSSPHVSGDRSPITWMWRCFCSHQDPPDRAHAAVPVLHLLLRGVPHLLSSQRVSEVGSPAEGPHQSDPVSVPGRASIIRAFSFSR